MAEWSKAPALGAGPKGRGFEPHCCQFWIDRNFYYWKDAYRETNSKTTSGLWCSGITSALHAEGLGFKPRQVHFISNLLR